MELGEHSLISLLRLGRMPGGVGPGEGTLSELCLFGIFVVVGAIVIGSVAVVLSAGDGEEMMES